MVISTSIAKVFSFKFKDLNKSALINLYPVSISEKFIFVKILTIRLRIKFATLLEK